MATNDFYHEATHPKHYFPPSFSVNKNDKVTWHANTMFNVTITTGTGSITLASNWTGSEYVAPFPAPYTFDCVGAGHLTDEAPNTYNQSLAAAAATAPPNIIIVSEPPMIKPPGGCVKEKHEQQIEEKAELYSQGD